MLRAWSREAVASANLTPEDEIAPNPFLFYKLILKVNKLTRQLWLPPASAAANAGDRRTRILSRQQNLQIPGVMDEERKRFRPPDFNRAALVAALL